MDGLTGIVITMFMAALDATIVGTAMPRLVADLNGFELYAAVTTVYLLATTVVVPIVGKLSDIYGRKPFLLAGVVIFVGGSALCGAARTMTELVLFRGLQGIGGGFAQAMAFTRKPRAKLRCRSWRVSSACAPVAWRQPTTMRSS